MEKCGTWGVIYVGLFVAFQRGNTLEVCSMDSYAWIDYN